ncbi:MAG: hypothetical protein NVS1B13_19160 [Flavisolibacter sp.]
MDRNFLLHAYRLMYSVTVLSEIYEDNRQITKYVHSTSRGHEAIQLATAFSLKSWDWVSPYYRDESMLLGMGWTPYELMLQLLTRKDDPFSGGRSYYAHPNSTATDKPKIIHQSSATGMQAIPTTGIAQGLQYLEQIHSTLLERGPAGELPVVVCSLGDASVTEGEVSEAFQFAILKGLPIIYLVQDNQWGISVPSEEGRAMDAYEYAEGFPGLSKIRVDGTDFIQSYATLQKVIQQVREQRRPWLVHAKVCLLNHHTSGVRKEFYRSEENLASHFLNDPLPKLRALTLGYFSEEELIQLESTLREEIKNQFTLAVAAPEPDVAGVVDHIFVPTPIK